MRKNAMKELKIIISSRDSIEATARRFNDQISATMRLVNQQIYRFLDELHLTPATRRACCARKPARGRRK
jgi:hypothetical protein